MNKKRTYFVRSIALLCAIALPLHTISSERPQNPQKRQPRRQITRRRRTSPGPRRSIKIAEEKQTSQQAQQQPTAIIPQQPTVPAVQTQPTPIAEIDEDEMIPAEELEGQPETFSDEKNAESTIQPPSKVMTFVYATLIPVLLLSFSKAFEKGLTAMTKSSIKNFMARSNFLRLNEKADAFANNLVNKELLLAASTKEDDPNYDAMLRLQNTPREDLIARARNHYFKIHKLNFEQEAEETSLPTILSKTASGGMINTIANLTSDLLGLGLTIAINYLLPEKQ